MGDTSTGSQNYETKGKTNASLWFSVSVGTSFFSLLVLATLWPDVWHCRDPALRKMVNSSFCFLAAPGLFLHRDSPRIMSADASLKISRDGAAGRSAQGKALFRMEAWREELKLADFGPEVHHQRLPGDTFFCLMVNSANQYVPVLS